LLIDSGTSLRKKASRGNNAVRHSAFRVELLSGLMEAALSQKPDVLVTWGTPGAMTAKQLTRTVPIVDAIMGDPLTSGIVSSLAHPEGNLTGISMGAGEGLGGKWVVC
jgi:putative ABC transport system substrate-binding protein